MKRGIIFFIVFSILCSFNGFAFFADTSSHIDTLTKCGIVEDISNETLSSNITRRDCLEYIIKVSGELYGDVSECSFKNYGIKAFADVQSFTSDCQLVITAYINGILKGKINEKGEITADLDANITWQEAIVMLDRLFLTNIYSDERLNSDTGWYDFASEIGIIKTSDLVFNLNINQKCDLVCRNDFLYFLNSAMHTPRYIMTYSGMKAEYLIDNFIK